MGTFPYAQEDKDSMEELLAELKQMKGDLEVSQKCWCTERELLANIVGTGSPVRRFRPGGGGGGEGPAAGRGLPAGGAGAGQEPARLPQQPGRRHPQDEEGAGRRGGRRRLGRGLCSDAPPQAEVKGEEVLPSRDLCSAAAAAGALPAAGAREDARIIHRRKGFTQGRFKKTNLLKVETIFILFALLDVFVAEPLCQDS